MPADTRKQTFIVATLLCLICSILVSTAAVVLRPRQQENRKLDIQRNILRVAGILNESADVAMQFRQVETVLVMLGSGPNRGVEVTAEEAAMEGVHDVSTYDARKTAVTEEIPAGALPQITSRELFSFVYKVSNSRGELDQVILPIYGKGLWSTLYGFIAIDADGVTIRGITFYEHGETPGLGGEVDNAEWKARWSGKQAFGEVAGRPIRIKVSKGQVNPDSETAPFEVDGLSGATITSNGVTSLVQYWLGPHGFGQYLENVRDGQGLEQSDG